MCRKKPATVPAVGLAFLSGICVVVIAIDNTVLNVALPSAFQSTQCSAVTCSG